ncbi:MAG: hypothetical protein JWR32_2632 [Mycobacterium sp.]|jgi:hypothetical protein|nr:hypothetical protein [Mycobacterium sp.]
MRGPDVGGASARHCSNNSAQASSSGLAGRVAFCAADSCAADKEPSTTLRLWAAHSRSWVERRDHAVMVSRSTPASSAIPVDGSTGAHSSPIDWCSSRRSVA